MRVRGAVAGPPGCRGTRVPGSLLEDHANRLIRAPASALPDEIAAALRALGRRLRADRVTLWELRAGGREAVVLHRWARPIGRVRVTTLTADEVPWLMRELAEGRRVAYRSLTMLPREASRERKLFARHGPRSAAIVPLVVGGSTVAVLAAGMLGRERGWGSATIALLEQVGAALANAALRKRDHDVSIETEGRLAGVLEAGPDAILLVRRDGRIELANGRATAIFLRARPELCGARLQDLLATSPETVLRARRATIDALLASREPLELSSRRGDGSTVPVAVTMHEVRTPGDELFCCVLRDLSEDRRAREEATRLRNELAFLGRTALLAEMGAGIAHELNQPLTAILSNAESAHRLLGARLGREDEELGETLLDVVNDTRRAADVLERMREMLRRTDVQRVPVDVSALLESAARRFREEAVARSIRLSVEVVPGVPRVLGDPVQLEQVVTNLVLNAFDAMGARAGGPRTIEIRARPTDPDGVDVSVRDSGPGLDDKALAHAFDAFFTTKPGGLGMGLGISRTIVEAHGGRLLARNNADRGATFEFQLPAATHDAAAVRRRPV